MQPIHEMVTLTMSGEASSVSMKELVSDRYLGKVNRILVVDTADRPCFLVHKSRVDEYRAEVGPVGDRKLSDFIRHQEAKVPPVRYDAGHGFVTVAAAATLGSVKAAMEAAAGVSDVIVTRRGGSNEPVWGWITDVQLRENLPS